MRYEIRLILAFGLVAGVLTLAGMPAASDDAPFAKAVFYVQWYDVGKAALEGLNGVVSVTRGFSGWREINTVTFDPAVIDREQMIAALKQAGTFRGVKE
jgi:hypothetical protein